MARWPGHRGRYGLILRHGPAGPHHATAAEQHKGWERPRVCLPGAVRTLAFLSSRPPIGATPRERGRHYPAGRRARPDKASAPSGQGWGRCWPQYHLCPGDRARPENVSPCRGRASLDRNLCRAGSRTWPTRRLGRTTSRCPDPPWQASSSPPGRSDGVAACRARDRP